MNSDITAFPKAVKITEVCPRDGFQNVSAWIATGVKLAILDQLLAAGVQSMEVTSFVNPKAVPQMADAMEVARHVAVAKGLEEPVALVPNRKGAERAIVCGIPNISYVISASPAHNKANINRTLDESLTDLKAIASEFPALHITLTVATAFGCPFLGQVPVADVLKLIERGLANGAKRVTLCDTIGVANPLQTALLVDAVRSAFGDIDVGLHMHNTHGMALANMLAGLMQGTTRFETAAGGLGGCPFAPGAAGNAATEDTVNMFHRMGIETGISLSGLLEAVKTIRQGIQSCQSSCLSVARTYSEFDFFKRQN